MSEDLVRQLREAGRPDLADHLGAASDEATANGNAAGVSIFGGTDQDDAAAVAAALRRDLREDR